MTRHLWDKALSRRLGVAIIAALAAGLAGSGAARAQTPISRCPYTIRTAGPYVLAADLSCSGQGINIAVSNVNLMLNDHTITGSGVDIGINICALSSRVCSAAAISNIQVQGPGLIQQFANGIYLQNVGNSKIQKVVVSTNNSYGILSSGGTNLQFNANVISANVVYSPKLEGFPGIGLSLNNDSNDQVDQNAFTLNIATDIAIHGGSGHHVHNNDVSGTEIGIYIKSSHNVVYDNTVSGTIAGIEVDTGSAGNNIHNNTSEGNFPLPKGVDLYDANTSPPCGTDTWQNNTFFYANQSCIH